MKKLRTLVDLLEQKKAALVDVEEQLKQLKKDIKRIEEEDIPDTMAEMSAKDFTFDDGMKVEVKAAVDANITEKNAPAAFEWLQANKFEDIIKNTFKIEFRHEDDEEMAELVDFISERGTEFSAKRSVHPQTLKAFVRERLMSGDAIPFDLFGVRQYRTTKITKQEN